MRAYEFFAKVTPDGKVAIPKSYTQDIPIDSHVRVIILVSEIETRDPDEQAVQASPLFLSLNEVIAKIKSIPSNPANIQPASGLLAEHLADSPDEPDPSFDVVAWNKEWDKVEAEMEAIELGGEV